MRTVEYLGQPCRNFGIRDCGYIPCDPYDGHEKYVLSSTGTQNLSGHIIFIDTQTLEGEDFLMPGDVSCYAMSFLPESEQFVVGTCGYFGYVHVLDLRSRTWKKPLNIAGEDWLWSSTVGGDGKVYYGTYPGCKLLCYDPAEHTLTDLGKFAKNPSNLYARDIFTLPDGNILISIGKNSNETHRYDIKTGSFTQLFGDGFHVETVGEGMIYGTRNGQHCFYDANTLEELCPPMEKPCLDGLTDLRVIKKVQSLIDPPYKHLFPYDYGSGMKTLKDGRTIGYFQQQYFIIEKDEQGEDKITFRDIPVQAPPMTIHNMAADPEGTLWYAANFGQTMGCYNPKTDAYWNSRPIAQAGGEPYGIVPYKGKIYFTCYVGGDHIVYDPKQPWNQFEDVNPKNLGSVAPLMIRPESGSVMGSDKRIWTGWCAKYGAYGGGISRLDPETGKLDYWFDLVPEQCIGHIAAGRKHIYALSHWMANGMVCRQNDAFTLLKLDTEGNILWRKKFEKDQGLEHITVAGGRVFMGMRDKPSGFARIYVYEDADNDDALELVDILTMGELGEKGKYEREVYAVRGLHKFDDRRLLIQIDKKIHVLDTQTLQILETVEIPMFAEKMAVAPEGMVYVSSDAELFRFRLDV